MSVANVVIGDTQRTWQSKKHNPFFLWVTYLEGIIYEVFGIVFISPKSDFEDDAKGDKHLKKEVYKAIIEPTVIKEAIKDYIADSLEAVCGTPLFSLGD